MGCLKNKKIWIISSFIIVEVLMLIFIGLMIHEKRDNKRTGEETQEIYDASNSVSQETNNEKMDVESESEQSFDEKKDVDRKNTDETQNTVDFNTELDKQNEERISLVDQGDIPTIVIPKAKAKSGDTVELVINLINNPGILGMSLTLSYDESIVSLVEIKNGKAVEEVLSLTYSNSLANGCIFLWDGIEISPEQVKDGELAVLKFEVLETDFVGTIPIVLIADEGGTIDNDLKTVNLVVENGEIIVEK